MPAIDTLSMGSRPARLRGLERKPWLRALCYGALAAVLSLSAGGEASDIPAQISFQNLMDNRDVTTGEIDAVLQDSQGFIWVGAASALYRYDAYEFKQVDASTGAGKPKTAIKFIKSLFEDSQRKLWVATRSGLYRYDPNTETLSPVGDSQDQALKISSTSFTKVVELASGEILACSLAGLFVIDPISLKYSVISAEDGPGPRLNGTAINTALVSDSGDLWLGTNQGLEYLHWRSKTVTLYKPVASQPELVAENVVTAIAPDKNQAGFLWLGTAKGLVHYDTQTHRSTRYAHALNDPNSLAADDIWALLVDSQGTLWVATDGGGINLFDQQHNRFSHHSFEAGVPSSLSSSKPRSIYEDKNGDIWVGNFPNGLNFYDRASAAIQTYAQDLANPNSLSHSAVVAIAEEPSGNLWVGTDGGGLNYFNRASASFTQHQNEPNNPASLSGNAIPALYRATSGEIWASAYGADLNLFNPANQSVTRYPMATRTPTQAISTSMSINGAPAVWSIKKDADSEDLWMSSRTGGISRFNPKTQEFTNYYHLESDPDSIVNNCVWITLEDSHGNFWVGTAGGLDRLDKTTGKFEHYAGLSNPSAISLLEDRKQRLWVGTDAGLNLLDPATKTFKAFTKAHGFIDDTIRSLVEDPQGILWLSTLNGFASFNPDTHKIKTYNRIAGRLTGGFSRSGILTRQGEVVFGGPNGLRIFKPELLADNAVPPQVALTDFKLFSDSVVIGADDGLLTRSINATHSITLNYTQSMFTLEFAALNFRDSAKNQFAYKLEGFDQDWIHAGSARTAKYTNLSPGHYVFKVKGSNNDGLWSQEEKTLSIIQLPPPWKSAWAYGLYVLLVIALVLALLNWQRNKRRAVEAQNRLLEQKVLERTAVIREKNSDIQAMLSNMQQGLFTIEVGGHIHPEYSRFLEQIFETASIAGADALNLLFSRAQLSPETLDKIQQTLRAMLGANKINFTLNAHLLISEYQAKINGQLKDISLDWSPVLLEKRVLKVMVSVRDVTHLKKMETEARRKKRELDIISQLLNVAAHKYLAFAASAQNFIDDNRQRILGTLNGNTPLLEALLRNMHTLKGNCRTFGFDYLSDLVHSLESSYSALKAAPETAWPQADLLADLQRLEQLLQQYQHAYDILSSRADQPATQRSTQGHWACSHTLETLQHSIASLVQEFPALQDAAPLAPIQQWLSLASSTPLAELLDDIIQSLGPRALTLDKEPPRVMVEQSSLRIKAQASDLIKDIFTHILANALDHGIETSQQRVHAGKAKAGQISIRTLAEAQSVRIYIQDDGRGLAIDQLFQGAVAAGKWQPEDQPSPREIAEMMFAPGISTKGELSQLSGRGIGLNAVMEDLLAHNGRIYVQFLAAQPEATPLGQGNMLAFELVIELPASVFTFTAS